MFVTVAQESGQPVERYSRVPAARIVFVREELHVQIGFVRLRLRFRFVRTGRTNNIGLLLRVRDEP